MNAVRKLINKYIPNRAVVAASQICIEMQKEGYDQKTILEFLHRFEEEMTGVELGREAA